ncbi:MAG: hypothetical protein COA78_08740 [Blastopirellula sp.]|nr:MAG: hypothetical protein COA78_08740 [Blastopirellula sp.]
MLTANALGEETQELSFQNPDVVKGAENSIVREIASAVIIPGETHKDLWVHPNLVTTPGNPIETELSLRTTDRSGGDRHTVVHYFRTDDDFQSLLPIESLMATAWSRIGLTPANFQSSKGGIEVPDGSWHWARNSVQLDQKIIVYPFLIQEGERRSVRTVTARQHGNLFVPLYISNALTNEAGRGLLEPQIVEFQGRLYMTMRAEDGFGYVSVSDDQGKSWSAPHPWRWHDGEKIPMHTTMTKLLSHTDGMLLVYTRIRDDNQNVFRNRAPLYCADVDPKTLSLRRQTERVLIPNRGQPVGNFWVWLIDQNKSYVCAAEWPRDSQSRSQATNGHTWLAKIYWKQPNQRMTTQGHEQAALKEK